MNKFIIGPLLSLLCINSFSQTFTEWKDPTLNEVNRSAMHTHYFAFNQSEQISAPEASENYLSLHGDWKFNWVRDSDQRPSGFWDVAYDDKAWDTIKVPGVWELNGYGDPIYVNTGYAWRNQFSSNPPVVPVYNNHVGSYRREFDIPISWKKKDVIMHIGSATSCVYVWINGKFVGYSEDSKLEAEFDVTKYLVPGRKNLIAMQIFRWCDGTYLEDQDFFRYSGIARDCYFYARSKSRIEDIRVTPDLDANYENGILNVEVSFKGKVGRTDLELFDANGAIVARSSTNGVKNDGKTNVIFQVANPRKWSAETPYLYTLKASASGETIPVKVGFRKVEIRNSQLLVNGKPILIKGANRHEIDPDSGYLISRERMLQDIQIMKKFNLNAVRTCHYPDDNFWYDLCDEYGIYIVAEANIESHGMGYGDRTLAKRSDYTLAHMQRNQRNVQRSFNHPAVIIWSLGNEAGYGPNFEAAYDWIKSEDHSRPVQYEQARINGKTDIYCPMYAGYDGIVRYATNPDSDKPLIQCEYAHAMGNSEGGFKEYWDLYRKYDKLQGGFIWDFVDQSVRWKGKNGVMIYAYGGDFNRYDGSDYNFCDNGLISPDRIPNPHMYEVGYCYQSIWTDVDQLSSGWLSVYNENFFRDLSAYRLVWYLLNDGVAVRSGMIDELEVEPQGTELIPLQIGSIDSTGEWLLNVRYELKEKEGLLPAGHVVAKQQFVLKAYDFGNIEMSRGTHGWIAATDPVINTGDRTYLIVRGDDFVVEISRKTGYITRYCVKGTELLKEGSSITPNFWRAPTDNDFGANLQRRYVVWKNPHIVLKGSNMSRSVDRGQQPQAGNAIRPEPPITSTVENGIAKIVCKLEIVDIADLLLTYEIDASGAVKVTESMVADTGKEIPGMFRFGMQIVMPKSFDKVAYYGRGPMENYSDRKAASEIGRYSQYVKEQFYPYIRPQETGTKSDIRWWKVLNPAGQGIQITSESAFSASALHYTIESLDEGLSKQNGHSQEVPESDLTNVLIDKAQMGLGCVNSWGALPLESYQLPYKDYEFVFLISPVQNQF
ncbi:MAG: glycoside hydrolase family 2 TIM barrel-domain containing protein [Candidatus Cryptobacteroides sp.]|jgi:beta-galactosidase